MPNHYYVISEVQFFDDKDDENTLQFVSGTGIDLTQACYSRMPNLAEIKKALSELGLSTTTNSYDGNSIEVIAIKEDSIGLWLLFTNLENESTPINMFEVARGSDPELTIDFIQSMAKSHGNFLYCFDGGKMSLVTKGKDKQIIMSEIYSD